MTIDDYKSLYPQDAVFVQVDDYTRTMTDEEYEEWVTQSVHAINNPLPSDQPA